jgi:hypothetical protein
VTAVPNIHIPLPFQWHDGGRAAAGFPDTNSAGEALRDCVCRAIATASERDYGKVHEKLCALGWSPGTADRLPEEMADVDTCLKANGWTWTPFIGRLVYLCAEHLCADGLPPSGRLIVRCNEHLTAVIDGVVHDTFNCSETGLHCEPPPPRVFGYYQRALSVP